MNVESVLLRERPSADSALVRPVRQSALRTVDGAAERVLLAGVHPAMPSEIRGGGERARAVRAGMALHLARGCQIATLSGEGTVPYIDVRLRGVVDGTCTKNERRGGQRTAQSAEAIF